jgi:hypothetical protein
MPDLPDIPRTESAIVELTNALRRDNKLGPVAPNKQLEAAAKWFADYLARTGKFAHEADGRQAQDRVAAQGYKYCLVAENLALNLNSHGFTSEGLATDAVEGWKNSPLHHRNLVEPDATEIGVAVARVPDQYPKFVSVQLFGRPESLKIKFSLDNETNQPISYTLGEETHTIEPNTTVTHEHCQSGPLRLEQAGTGIFAKRLDMQISPQNGAAFVLSAAPDGGVRADTKRAGRK